jgi:hypothetical protein
MMERKLKVWKVWTIDSYFTANSSFVCNTP